MLETELYKEKLKQADFGSTLLDWAKSMMPSIEKEILLRDRDWSGSLLNYYLLDVADFYVRVKATDLQGISFTETVAYVGRVGGYQYAPLSRTPFLALLYGMMRADDTCRSYHQMNDKARKLMEFMDDYCPDDAEVLRNIVLHNSREIPAGSKNDLVILEEAEESLHPELRKAMMDKYGKTINITVNGPVNIDKNFGPISEKE